MCGNDRNRCHSVCKKMSQFQPLNPPRFNYVEAHAEDRAFECAASYVHTLELKIIEAIQALKKGVCADDVVSILTK